MPKKFSVTIKGFQTYCTGEDDTNVELVSECSFYKKDDKFFCDYKESEITGLGGTDTSIEIGSDYVSLNRTGTVNSQMLFIKGRKTSSFYKMPFGELAIDIHTKSLDIDIDENGGRLLVDYIIDINNASSSHNTFDITIREDN